MGRWMNVKHNQTVHMDLYNSLQQVELNYMYNLQLVFLSPDGILNIFSCQHNWNWILFILLHSSIIFQGVDKTDGHQDVGISQSLITTNQGIECTLGSGYGTDSRSDQEAIGHFLAFLCCNLYFSLILATQLTFSSKIWDKVLAEMDVGTIMGTRNNSMVKVSCQS